MLRDKNLIPLSHQHQRALALCVRIERASPIPEHDLEVWQDEISQHCRAEIALHFAAEEMVVFPRARGFEELHALVDELSADHALLRGTCERAERRSLSSADLLNFSRQLSTHIRKEERQLFERLQELLSSNELAHIGEGLTDALKTLSQACVIPTEQTKLRPTK